MDSTPLITYIYYFKPLKKPQKPLRYHIYIASTAVHPVILSCIHPFLMDFHKTKCVDVLYSVEVMYLCFSIMKNGWKMSEKCEF